MKWKTKPEPQPFDIRIKEHFLFLPKKINNEWRWLEKAKYKQSCEFSYRNEIKYIGWEDKEWIDEREEKCDT